MDIILTHQNTLQHHTLLTWAIKIHRLTNPSNTHVRCSNTTGTATSDVLALAALELLTERYEYVSQPTFTYHMQYHIQYHIQYHTHEQTHIINKPIYPSFKSTCQFHLYT